MSPTSLMTQARQSLAEFWTARDARERTMLAAAGAVIALALIHILLVDPALSGRERLNRNLPALRQQVAQLQALAKEAAALSGKPAPAMSAITREGIEAALARKGLKPQNVMLSGDLVQVKLASVSFSGTMGWLEDMQKTALLSVADANIVALPQPDLVDATLTLRQPKNE
ncbi:MAG: type II secretion system protein M [Nitrosomonadales bacterium]|nr:type II secretion system protein M [Nitrosomonadales bacterium]